MTTARGDAVEGESLIKQGAEALAFTSTILPWLPLHVGTTASLGGRCVRKHRPPKPYRHPVLDKRLTTHRILMEARLLQRLRRANVPVPAVLFVDSARGDLFMEFIPGQSVRDYLISAGSPVHAPTAADTAVAAAAADDTGPINGTTEDKVGMRGQGRARAEVSGVMGEIGRVIAGMHGAEVCHGDLTTSNLLVTTTTAAAAQGEGGVTLIDFGLGSVSVSIEDYAVDLYVLERAFLSTHPSSGEQFELILAGYLRAAGARGRATVKRLEAVRLRGRKRTMVG